MDKVTRGFAITSLDRSILARLARKLLPLNIGI